MLQSFAPRAVAGGHAFVTLSSGDFHSCGLTAAGEAHCWGDHYWGQIGDGSPSGNELNTVRALYPPRAVAGGFRFRAIATRGSHSCAATTEGDAHCWGFNARIWRGNTLPTEPIRNYLESTAPLPVLGASGLGLNRLDVSNYLMSGSR